ncbi:biotin carboxylase N-terminal domain-containing protein [Carboxydochorda subterranea]|uniref:biotin carboxylase n=1 Tax=Carboxydichorda subterranea TaxID=3109565 RepID=A0ABZ1BVB9_9FIRM|nr:biotin carboxylase N-terminal domain-containing protein [Limnochorda sp. L945t]WRP16752.1 biotin carboxylase N-terminal domain-containing protein [Limnochorda sp. L945t]
MGPIFSSVLVANRGEIALRVIRALRELGIRAVLLASGPDRESLPARLADGVVVRDDPLVYLDARAVVEAARSAGADAVHPGYGFLSENPVLARLCREAGLTFIGPPEEVLAHFGNKDAARRQAERLGIPTIPGSAAALPGVEEARREAQRLGYPVLLKAVAGGGGRGMRRVDGPESLESAWDRASSEAAKAFGDGSLYLEKWLERVRHVEIQFAVDRYGKGVHFGERDCSIQRRHQKLAEEAPSPVLDGTLRRRMGEAAVRLAASAGYVGVGTAEFLVDEERRFYFIEVNARIQVEHPVTELVTGTDLVQLQMALAAGQPVPLGQEDVVLRGHAIEFRINAEDPRRGFLPNPGTIEAYLPPGGPGVRVDSAAFPGWVIPPFYDSLVAKLVVWAPSRREALARARRALEEFAIDGVRTTLPFHRWLVGRREFRDGEVTTRFVEQHFTPDQLPPDGPGPGEAAPGRNGEGAAAARVELAPGARREGVSPEAAAAAAAALQAYLGAPRTRAGAAPHDRDAGSRRRWRIRAIYPDPEGGGGHGPAHRAR